MKYKMKVTITAPETSEEMKRELQYDLDCCFCYDPDTYGKKTYLSITTEDRRFDNYYDLRYDENFHRDKKEKFLEYWAKSYWSGKNGAWTIKSLEITKA